MDRRKADREHCGGTGAGSELMQRVVGLRGTDWGDKGDVRLEMERSDEGRAREVDWV